MPLSDPTSPMENPARNPYSVLYGQWTHRLFRWLLISGLLAVKALGQQDSYTWQQIRERFEASNSTLLARETEHRRTQSPGDQCQPPPQSRFYPFSRRHPDRSEQECLATVRRHLRFTGSELSFSSDATSAGCVLMPQRKALRSVSPSKPTPNVICSSIYAVLLSASSKPKPCCAWHRTTWTTTTRF